MPIPKRNKEEKREEYIKRCMSDSVMVNEFPNEKQRYAVCQMYADSTNKKKNG